MRRRTGELLGRWHSQVDRLALRHRLAVPLIARGPAGGLLEVGLLGNGLVGGLLGGRFRNGLLGRRLRCGLLDDGLLGGGLGGGLPGSGWLACGLGRGLGCGALGAENHCDIRPRRSLRQQRSAGSFSDVCIHRLGMEQMGSLRATGWGALAHRSQAGEGGRGGGEESEHGVRGSRKGALGCPLREHAIEDGVHMSSSI